jgi:surface protein
MLADRVRMRFLETGPKPQDIADENCKVATDADFSGTTNGTFRYIGTATSLVIPHVIKGVPVTSYADMFSGATVTEVRSNNPNVTNMSSMFRYCQGITSLDLSSFDTSNVTNMYNMFYYCNSLTSLDLSSFDTSNVTNMSSMFRDCRGLTSLDLSSFNTSNVTNMNHMFRDCSLLTSLDLSSFDTSNVTNMNYMFRNCTSIITAYARTQGDADKLNTSSGKPSNVNFVVK